MRNKQQFYFIYWTAYLLLFSLVEGLTDHDFLQVFRNELISLPPKIIFVGLMIEMLFRKMPVRENVIRVIGAYVLLVLVFAFVMRLVDNDVILRYFLVHWNREPLLSAAPFLYNCIKLQFLLTIPFCIRLMALCSVPAETSSLLVKCERRMINLAFDDIYYFESQGNYLDIFTVNGTFKTYLPISALEAKLPGAKFARIHRSFVVALNKIESRNHCQVTVGHKKIPIGRSYVTSVRKIIPLQQK